MKLAIALGDACTGIVFAEVRLPRIRARCCLTESCWTSCREPMCRS